MNKNVICCFSLCLTVDIFVFSYRFLLTFTLMFTYFGAS